MLRLTANAFVLLNSGKGKAWEVTAGDRSFCTLRMNDAIAKCRLVLAIGSVYMRCQYCHYAVHIFIKNFNLKLFVNLSSFLA